MHAVDVVISDEGSGVMPLRGRGSDRAWALPYVRDCGELWEGPWGLIELDGVVVVLEAEPWKTAMGHARVFDPGIGEWTNWISS